MRSSAASTLAISASAPSSRPRTSSSCDDQVVEPFFDIGDVDFGELDALRGGDQRGVLLGAVALHLRDLGLELVGALLADA